MGVFGCNSQPRNLTTYSTIYQTPKFKGLDSIAWSPDSQRLAFDQYDPTSAEHTIYVLDISTHKIAPYRENDLYRLQSWSPDGRKFLLSKAGVSDSGIYVGDVDDANSMTFLSNGQVARWGAKPDAVAVLSDELSHKEFLRIVNVTDGTTKSVYSRIVYVDFAAIDLSWSPDGSKIAFSMNGTESNGNMDIYLLNLSTLQETKLTASGFNYSVTWSPEANLIAFVRAVSSLNRVIVIENLGNGCKLELTGLGSIGMISWSPDGKYLAFNRSEDINLIPIAQIPKLGELLSERECA